MEGPSRRAVANPQNFGDAVESWGDGLSASKPSCKRRCGRHGPKFRQDVASLMIRGVPGTGIKAFVGFVDRQAAPASVSKPVVDVRRAQESEWLAAMPLLFSPAWRTWPGR
jgi:hypothetical protein